MENKVGSFIMESILTLMSLVFMG